MSQQQTTSNRRSTATVAERFERAGITDGRDWRGRVLAIRAQRAAEAEAGPKVGDQDGEDEPEAREQAQAQRNELTDAPLRASLKRIAV